MPTLEIGCCGSFCKTCPELRQAHCKGCKIGYANGERDIKKARCRIKVCCIGKKLVTCADCEHYFSCETIQGFYAKNGYKYKKYREATLFIRSDGYHRFLELAAGWQRQYGKYSDACVGKK